MKKYEIVKKNTEFNDIINSGAYFKNKYYYIYYKDNDLNLPRFGLAVSKKHGNAVVRNKLKRQLRSIIDHNKKLFENKDYVIMVRKGIQDIPFALMEDTFKELFMRKENK